MSVGFQDTVTVLTTMKTKLEAMSYNAQPMFSKVALFDMSNLVVALQELLTFGERICLIVHDVEGFDNQKVGQDLHSKQHRDVTLLLADRHYADRQVALFGNGTDTPGALKIKDAILTNNQIIGPIAPGVMYCQPMSGEQLVLEAKDRATMQGRVAYSLGLRLVGGNVIINLGRQPIV